MKSYVYLNDVGEVCKFLKGDWKVFCPEL